MNALVVILGIAAIGAVNWWFFFAARSSGAATSVAGVQEVVITVRGGYDPAEVRVLAGQPARLVFDRQETSSCSEEIVIPAFNIRRFLPPHQRTAVELPAMAAGRYPMSCGMGMLHGELVVEAATEVGDGHHT
ncbi:MAG: cupredoxin domain-containing protein [Gemmatimonadales bacterium]